MLFTNITFPRNALRSIEAPSVGCSREPPPSAVRVNSCALEAARALTERFVRLTSRAIARVRGKSRACVVRMACMTNERARASE